MVKDLTNEHYLCKKDLQIYFGISKAKANQLFEWVDKIDDQDLGAYRLYPNKVRKSAACKVLQLDMKEQDEKMRTVSHTNPQLLK